MVTWQLEKKSVNSKVLFDEISSFIEEGLNDMGIMWSSDAQRDSFADIVEEWLEEVGGDGKIEQWKVICDYRNNKVAQMDEGKYVFDVYYKQRNCLNMTHLRYNIKDDGKDAGIIYVFTI